MSAWSSPSRPCPAMRTLHDRRPSFRHRVPAILGDCLVPCVALAFDSPLLPALHTSATLVTSTPHRSTTLATLASPLHLRPMLSLSIPSHHPAHDSTPMQRPAAQSNYALSGILIPPSITSIITSTPHARITSCRSPDSGKSPIRWAARRCASLCSARHHEGSASPLLPRPLRPQPVGL